MFSGESLLLFHGVHVVDQCKSTFSILKNRPQISTKSIEFNTDFRQVTKFSIHEKNPYIFYLIQLKNP